MKKLAHLTPKFFYALSVFAIISSMGFIALYLTVGPSLPDVDSIRKIQLQSPMRVYSKDHKLIAEFGNKKRIPITLDQVPTNFINALLSTEDERFYQHSGVDFLGVLRAVQRLIVTQTKSQGASTITMQVARNYYLTRAKRFSRKFTEMFLAWKIESELTKNEILELYLNKIPFGHRAFGLGAAAQVYYGGKLDQLSLAKLATLAGIPKGPSVFNPISNPEKTKIRRTHVLGRMLTENHINQQQYEQAMQEDVKTVIHTANISVKAEYVAEMVRREAINRFGVDATYHSGLSVYTTIDSTLQDYAQLATKEALEEYDQRHGYRGPEQQFEITDQTDDETLSLWINSVSVVADLQPALVFEVNEANQTASLLLQNAQKTQLILDDVLWAREYVDENHRGPTIKTISQVFKVGDLIRLNSQANTEGNITYKLAQLPEANAGFVSLKPDTGEIEALVGGYDYFYKKFNSVTQANRQLGSNIKPFIYSAAFEKGFTPASIINDMPYVEEDVTAENFWRPKNDSDNYVGPTTLRVGLRHSKNTVSIRLIKKIQPHFAKKYLTRIGFPAANMQPYPSLALGAPSFTPLQVVTAYATLANGGYKVAPWFIERVEDSDGQILQQHQPIQVCRQCERIIADQAANNQQQDLQTITKPASTEGLAKSDFSIENTTPTNNTYSAFINIPLLPIPEETIAPRVIDQRNLFLVDHILKDVIHRGTARRPLVAANSKLLHRNDLAGKTGTTNDAKDAWFSGYNTQHVATAWVGFDDHSRKLGIREFGGKAALPIWQKFMERAVVGTPEINHPRPEGIVTVRIDAKTGLLATSQTERTILEVFRSEDAPTKYADKGIEDIYNQNQEVVEEESLF